jgi:TRAP-type C4-dicarboxylate transport system permease small subunit
MPPDPEAKSARLIEVEDAEVQIEHHPEDWLAFAIFWALAAIVFLQFFTRYVLNDSVAWTEEIARYGLIWRMQVQRMTVVDLPRSWVYAAVVVGCCLMLVRQLMRVWRNARDGWRSEQEALTSGLVVEPAAEPRPVSPPKGPRP